MTPPPNAVATRQVNGPPCHQPPALAGGGSQANLSPADVEIKVRQMPLSEPIHYIDLLDIIDSMMAYRLTPATTRQRWNGRKAFVMNGEVVIDHLLKMEYAIGRTHAITIAHALVRSGSLIPTFRVQSSLMSFVALSTSTYVHRGLTCIPTHGLNMIIPYPYAARSMLTVLCDISSAFAQLCQNVLSEEGHFVNYENIRGSEPWRRLLIVLAELSECSDDDFNAVSDSVKHACFFNLYNVLIFHAKLVFGHPTDLVKRGKFFNDAAYVIAGKRITSVDLEHDVLRRRMSDDDDRVRWRVDVKDARMHFILNCGAQSCPPLTPIPVCLNADADRVIETVVSEATTTFIDHNVAVDLPSRRVTLSRLWKWFRKDFTPMSMPMTDKDDDLLIWIAQNASKYMSVQLTQLMKSDYRIKFDVYNWADNGNVNAKPDIRFMSIYDISFSRTA